MGKEELKVNFVVDKNAQPLTTNQFIQTHLGARNIDDLVTLIKGGDKRFQHCFVKNSEK